MPVIEEQDFLSVF